MIKYDKPYVAPTLVVDLVLFRIYQGRLEVLLLSRPFEPFKGHWALPGGYCPAGETTREALRRIVTAKVGINIENLDYLEQLAAFDTVARDPRGHAVSVVYIGGVDKKLKISQLSKNSQFIPVDDLPKVAFDHAQIIDLARAKLGSSLDHTTIANVFLTEFFTIPELQKVYEAILGRILDRRNFQKKFLRRKTLIDTGRLQPTPGARPAKLYKFKSPGIVPLNDSLD